MHPALGRAGLLRRVFEAWDGKSAREAVLMLQNDANNRYFSLKYVYYWYIWGKTLYC